MRSRFQWVWHALLSLLGVLVGAIVCVQQWLRCVAAPLLFVLACVLAPGCTCESARQAPSKKAAACISQGARGLSWYASKFEPSSVDLRAFQALACLLRRCVRGAESGGSLR